MCLLPEGGLHIFACSAIQVVLFEFVYAISAGGVRTGSNPKSDRRRSFEVRPIQAFTAHPGRCGFFGNTFALFVDCEALLRDNCEIRTLADPYVSGDSANIPK